MWVQDRKTGKWYDPVVEFARILKDAKTVAIMKRLKYV